MAHVFFSLIFVMTEEVWRRGTLEKLSLCSVFHGCALPLLSLSFLCIGNMESHIQRWTLLWSAQPGTVLKLDFQGCPALNDDVSCSFYPETFLFSVLECRF